MSKYTVAIAAKNKFSKPLDTMRASNERFTSGLQKSRAEIKKLNSLDRTIKTFDKSKKSVAALSTELATLKSHYKKANAAQGLLVNDSKKLGAAKKAKEAEIRVIERKVKKINELESSNKVLSKTQREEHSKALIAHKETLKNKKVELNLIAQKEKEIKKSLTLSEKEQAARKKQVKGLTQRYTKEQQSLKKVQKELMKTGVDTNNLAGAQAKLKRKTDKATKALDSQKAALKNVAAQERRLGDLQEKRSNMVGSVAAVGAGVLAVNGIVNKAADMETSMVEVEKKASFKTKGGQELSAPQQAQQMDSLQKLILRNAPRLGLQAEELANIIASGAGSNVARDGHEIADLNRFATLAAKMSNAFDDLGSEEAGKSVAAWKASMGLDMDQLEILAGAINHLSDNSAAATTAITQVLTDVGAVVMSTGMDEIQAAALSASILAANGNKAEMGRTATKNLALNMTSGEAASGPQKQMWQSLGFEAEQIAKDVQKDSVGTMYKVFEAIKKQPQYRQAAVIKTLFGAESIGSITPLINNMSELKRVMSQTNDKAVLRNSLDKEFEKLQVTYNFQKQRIASTFNALTASVGQHLLPMFNEVATSISDIMAGTTEFISNNKTLASVIIKSAAAVAALKAAQVAFRLGSISLEMLTGRRRLKEMQLGSAVGKSSREAIKAASAMHRLSRSLSKLSRNRRMGRGMGRGMGGGLGMDSDFDNDGRDKKGKRRSKGKGGRFRTLAANVSKSKVPLLSKVAAAGTLAYAINDGDKAAMAENVGSIGGSMAGAAAGAALGSVVPVVGTAIGGMIGYFAGDALGTWLGSEVGKKLEDETSKAPLKKEQAAQSDIKQPDLKLRVVNLDAISPTDSVAQHTKSENKTANKQANQQAVNINYSPSIKVEGNADKKQIEEALEVSQTTFMDNFKKEYAQLFESSLQSDLDTTFSDGMGELGV